MNRIPKVALLLETSSQFARGLLRGIIRYSRLHGPWSMYMGAGDSEQGLLKDVEFTGVIARICSLTAAASIKAKGLPVVVIEAATEHLGAADPLREFCEIRADARAITNMVIDHFVGKGLHSFAFCGFESAPWSLFREEAFQQTMADKGLPCLMHRIDAHNWMRYGDWMRSFGKAQSRLIRWLKSLPRFTGVMTCNDLCGLRVLEACTNAGIRVPAHLTVVGVDNDELMCELSRPPLSSVALDLEKAGYEAACLLDELMTNHTRRRKQVVPVLPLWVAERRSSDLKFRDDPLVAEALRFIKDHARRCIGVPDVVEGMGVSRRTLERRFIHAIGRSILVEINRSRVHRAECLLQETALPVCRVATEAGFINTRMFNRIFRQAKGLPPTVFRRRLQEQLSGDQQAD